MMDETSAAISFYCTLLCVSLWYRVCVCVCTEHENHSNISGDYDTATRGKDL